MRKRQLAKGLFLSTVLSVILHFGFCLILPEVKAYHSFFLLCLIIFLLFTTGILILADRAAGSTNLYLFNNLILITVIIKLFLGVGIVVFYARTQEPPDQYFVVPFLQVYLIFTIFETIALSELGKRKK